MTADLDRLLADPDDLRRHLRTAEAAAPPDPDVGARAINEWPRLSVDVQAAVVASPAVLLALYARINDLPPTVWSPALGEAGRRHRCRLDLTPPTWEEVAPEVLAQPARPADPAARVEDAVPAMKLAAPLRSLTSAGPRLMFWWSWERTPAELGWTAPDPPVDFLFKPAPDGSAWELTIRENAGALPGSLAVRLTRPRDRRAKTVTVTAVGTDPCPLPGLGPPREWLNDWSGGLWVTVSRADVDPPDKATEKVPGATFDAGWVSAWGQHAAFGFPACFQALYRRTGQPALTFRALVARLRNHAARRSEAGTSPLRGWRQFGNAICDKAWKEDINVPGGWRAQHMTPVEAVLGVIDRKRAGAEWGPLLADLAAAVDRLDGGHRQALAEPAHPLGPLAWHHLLAGLAEAGQPPARAVDLLLPIVPFGPSDDAGGKVPLRRRTDADGPVGGASDGG